MRTSTSKKEMHWLISDPSLTLLPLTALVRSGLQSNNPTGNYISKWTDQCFPSAQAKGSVTGFSHVELGWL